MRPLRLLCACLLCTALAACGGDGGQDTSPDASGDSGGDTSAPADLPPEDLSQDQGQPDAPPDVPEGTQDVLEDTQDVSEDVSAPDVAPDLPGDLPQDQEEADMEPDQAEDLPIDAPDMEPGPALRRWEALGEQVEVRVEAPDAALRGYQMQTTAWLRDRDQPGGQESWTEDAGLPRLRSGDLLFDAIFSLSMEEARRDSVSEIFDGAFHSGQGVPCECFETGESWRYVWTRDTAYAVDLGLAWLDPERASRSLLFKLSERKSGGDLQIVQDTGTGGSWPISTDRVVWALGAQEALLHLEGEPQERLRGQALQALVNTLALDREVAWDPRDGLYRGEQSFLDWREQSYASWMARDVVHIGTSKALSTNVGHLIALRLAAALLRQDGQPQQAQTLEAQAQALRQAIRDRFWLAQEGALVSLTGPELDPGPLHKFDLLGTSLAALHGVLSPEEARVALAAWPRLETGSAVLWPQQPDVPIYHNRGIWPFVSAYSALAARHVGLHRAFDHELASLLRGAAVNLSHMENFELTTQRPWVDDGALSGPVVNSRRQLWSVAGYAGVILKGVFGLQPSQEGLRVQPFVTPWLRDHWVGDQGLLELRGLSWRGHALTLRLHLPPQGTQGGAFTVQRALLNGQPVDLEQPLSEAALGEQATLEITLAPSPDPAHPALRFVEDPQDPRQLFAPREPAIQQLVHGDQGLRVQFAGNNGQGVVYHVWRDGQELATGVTGEAWTDATPPDLERNSPCYSVEAVDSLTGHRSHRSAPICYWGDGRRIQQLSIYQVRTPPGGQWSTDHDRPHYANWGDPGHTLEFYGVRPAWTGRYQLQLVYGNGAGPINTGVTAGLKLMVVHDLTADQEVGRGYLQMPHLGDWGRWADSSTLEVELDADHLYRVELRDALNMSWLAHFTPYVATGGGPEVFGRVNVAALKLLPRQGEPRAMDSAAPLAPGQPNTLEGFAPQQRLGTAIPLGEQGELALAWDEDHVYVAMRSEAFTDPYAPMQLYLEASPQPLGPAQAGAGQRYSEQTPRLPFAPSHLISLRRQSEAADPWNGLWAAEGDQWRQVRRLEPGQQWWSTGEGRVLAARVPRGALGPARYLRLAVHVPWGRPGHEWKEVLPPQHTPWVDSDAGYFEVDLEDPSPLGQWQPR